MTGGPVPTAGGPVGSALAALRTDPGAAGWCALPFFGGGEADRVAALVDAELAAGQAIAPAPADVFRALALTPIETVRAVILGQDPYPRPGDAHGLAFSFAGSGRVPPSLKTILAELRDDLGIDAGSGGDLSAWARTGVLLLNSALTTRAGESGRHLRIGWSHLTDQILDAVSRQRPAVAFLLWGNPARARAGLIDSARHLVLETGHPSPLNRARDFPGSRPFSRANAWLLEQGERPIDWRL